MAERRAYHPSELPEHLMRAVREARHPQADQPHLYTVDGLPFHGQPDGYNAKGYPFVVRPVKLGAAPTHQRLYTREHLERLGKPVFGPHERQLPPAQPDIFDADR